MSQMPDRQTFNSEVSGDKKPEKKSLSGKQIAGIAMAGVAIFAAAFGGVAATKLMEKPKPIVESPQPPNDMDEGEVVQPQDIPKEAKDFVDQFGNRYADPVSTYYSVLEYNKNTGNSILLTDEAVGTYELDNLTNGEKSFIGFTMGKMPLGIKVEQKDIIKVFNEHEAKNMSLYMNLIAKNPSSEARAVIDNQFMNYCQDETLDANGDIKSYDDKARRASDLLDTLSGVVDKYGSSANYEVATAITSKYGEETGHTLFNSDIPTTIQGENSEIFVDNGINLLINVDIYEGKTISRQEERIKDFQQTIVRSPYFKDSKFSYISFGQNVHQTQQ